MKNIFTIGESNKTNEKLVIGENGVGINQSTIMLANTTVALSISGNSFGMALYDYDLMSNTEQLPAKNLPFNSLEDLRNSFPQWIQEHFGHADYRQAVCAVGNATSLGNALDNGHYEAGVAKLNQQVADLIAFHEDDKTKHQNVFQVYLFNVGPDSIIDSVAIEKEYLHLTKDRVRFEIRNIDLAGDVLEENVPPAQELEFTYWQRRLVGLTAVRVPICKNVCYRTVEGLHQALAKVNKRIAKSTSPNNALNEECLKLQEQLKQCKVYELDLYMGYDPISLKTKKDSRVGSRGQVIWYTRENGRHIKAESADHLFCRGLSGGGYGQGLRIIVSDFNGELPLNPSKTDFAFPSEVDPDTKKPYPKGVHERNLKAQMRGWSDAVWKYDNHQCIDESLGKPSKQAMVKSVSLHLKEVEASIASGLMPDNKPFEVWDTGQDEHVRTLACSRWVHSASKHDKEMIWMNPQEKGIADTTTADMKGPVWKFKPLHINIGKRKKTASKKRKRTDTESEEDEDEDEEEEDEDEDEDERKLETQLKLNEQQEKLEEAEERANALKKQLEKQKKKAQRATAEQQKAKEKQKNTIKQLKEQQNANKEKTSQLEATKRECEQLREKATSSSSSSSSSSVDADLLAKRDDLLEDKKMLMSLVKQAAKALRDKKFKRCKSKLAAILAQDNDEEEEDDNDGEWM